MFDFTVYTNEDKTLAVLEDGDYSVRFFATERFTSIVGKVNLGEEHQRVCALRHLHNEKKVGAYAHDVIGYCE